MAVDKALPVVMGGDDTGAASVGGGRAWLKFSGEVIKNVLKRLKSTGRNREGIPGSGEEYSENPNPIISLMEKYEVGKSVITLAVPMTTATIFVKPDALPKVAADFMVVANAVGIAAIWNGLLLRKTWPTAASFAEQMGVASVFLGFHTLVGSYLPPELRFVPALCWCLSVVPFVMAAFSGGGIDEQPQAQGVIMEEIRH